MVHDGAGAGQGLDTLTRDAPRRLSSDEFWGFVERLAIGRRVVITSDHGYAATGLFFDAGDEQAAFLKATFKSGRFVSGEHDPDRFVPPVALPVQYRARTKPAGRWALEMAKPRWLSDTRAWWRIFVGSAVAVPRNNEIGPPNYGYQKRNSSHRKSVGQLMPARPWL